MEPIPISYRPERPGSRSLLLMPRWRVAAVWFAIAILVGWGATGFLLVLSMICIGIGLQYLLPCVWLHTSGNAIWSCDRWYSGVERHGISDFLEVILRRDWFDQSVTYRVVLNTAVNQFDLLSDLPQYDRSLGFARRIAEAIGCELRDEHQLLGEAWSLEQLLDISQLSDAEPETQEGMPREEIDAASVSETLEIYRHSKWSWAFLPAILIRGAVKLFALGRLWQRQDIIRILSITGLVIIAISGLSWLIGRSGVVCDRRRQRVWKWRAVRWLSVGIQIPFNDIQRVTITPRSLRIPTNHWEPALRYVVGLEGRNVAFTVEMSEDSDAAWVDAIDLALFLNCELLNFTNQPIDVTVVDSRLRKPEADWVMPPPPIGSRIEIRGTSPVALASDQTGGILIVTIPPPRRLWKWLLWLFGFFSPAFFIGFCVMTHMEVFGAGFARNWRDLAALLTCVSIICWMLGLLAVLIPVLRVLRRKEVLQLSADQMIFDRRSLFDVQCHAEITTRRVCRIEIGRPSSRDLIMDLNGFFAPRKVLRIEGRDGFLEIGGSLTDGERQWLRELITAVVTSARYTRDS